MKLVSLSYGRLNPDSSVALSIADARVWWQYESARAGTDWCSLLDATEAVLSRLRGVHGRSS